MSQMSQHRVRLFRLLLPPLSSPSFSSLDSLSLALLSFPTLPSLSYKFNDPTHPCRTCWKKYGRPYTSAMALSWEQGVQGSSNWQRPLGVYQAPQIQNYGGGGYPGYGGQSGGYYRPVHPPVSFLRSLQSSTLIPFDGSERSSRERRNETLTSSFLLLSSLFRSSLERSSINLETYVALFSFFPSRPSSSHSLTFLFPPVRFLQPRIGGRPCYRCGGSGQILGFFDNDTCQVCRGIGRVF